MDIINAFRPRPNMLEIVSAMYEDFKPQLRIEGEHLMLAANNQIAQRNLHSVPGMSDMRIVAEFISTFGGLYVVSQMPLSSVLSGPEVSALSGYYPFKDISLPLDYRSALLFNIMIHKYAIVLLEHVPATDAMRQIVWNMSQMSLLQVIKSRISRPSLRAPFVWGYQNYEESGEFMLDPINMGFASVILEALIVAAESSVEVKRQLLTHHLVSGLNKVIKAVEAGSLIALFRKPNMEALKNDKVI